MLAGTGEMNGGTADPMADGRKGLGERGGDGGGDARVSEHAGALLAAAALSWLIASALRGRQRPGLVRGSRLGLLLRGGRARALALVLLAAAVGALSRSQRAMARLRQLEELSRPEARRA